MTADRVVKKPVEMTVVVKFADGSWNKTKYDLSHLSEDGMSFRYDIEKRPVGASVYDAEGRSVYDAPMATFTENAITWTTVEYELPPREGSFATLKVFDRLQKSWPQVPLHARLWTHCAVSAVAWVFWLICGMVIDPNAVEAPRWWVIGTIAIIGYSFATGVLGVVMFFVENREVEAKWRERYR